MEIRIGRVLSAKSSKPAVVANVGGERVTWNGRPGWKCSCGGEPDCKHIEALLGVVDPSVFIPRAKFSPKETTAPTREEA